ncbi:hypothetical protein [Mesobacillus jeotgali]|uniref:hypothetical protein n=1 Tax=Mesobacillus jeotgali TaxID=129985 RepID=UPI0009A909A7|nr:hypothetical protein [Mesobacillus jeotgali]
MKKLILVGVLLIGVSIGYLYSDKDLSNIVVSEGKLQDSYESLDEMEKQTPLILIGKKISGESIIDRDEEGFPNYYFTVSDFKVHAVIKNDTGRKIEKNQEVSILETSAFDKNQGQLLSVSGYLPMENDKQYMLFLEPNDSEKGPAAGSFNIQGVVMGKKKIIRIGIDLRIEKLNIMKKFI